MTAGSNHADRMWGEDDRQLATVARNVGTRYMAIILDALIGLVLLPFNVHHLGQSAYGLWMLTASMTTYFSVLDLGFGGSIVKFVAQYRARRDAEGLNDIASTLFVIFTITGVVSYAIFLLLAFNIQRVFNLSPEQLSTGRSLTLIIGVYVSMGFPFSIFGGIINGFQRYDLNNIVGVCSSVVVAIVNVMMLLAGATLVELVMVTTTLRIITYFVYRLNAYRVFPALRIQPSHFQWARVRELTSFSIYVSIIDWANKLNYSIDALIIGAYISSAAVALWTVPQRLAEMLQRLTNQLNGVLFPVVVDSDAGRKPEMLRAIFVRGTQLSLVSVVPLAAALFLLMDPLIRAWVGPKFMESILVAQILICVVAIRVGSATATTVLKGAGQHRLLAFTNAGTAVANIVLSLMWIRHYGLIGQAVGTLIPVAVSSAFILWPAACRRVGMGVFESFMEAVWPTLWPIAAMAVVVIPIREALPARLWAVAVGGAIGSLVYFATFVAFAVTSSDRKLYLEKVNELISARRRRIATTAAA